MSFYNSFEEIFQEMKKRLTLTPTAMKLWIEPLKPLKLNNNHVMLYVESQFSKDMTMANFKTVMEEAFSDLLGFDVEVEILCSEDLTVEQKLKYGIESYADSSPKELQKELDDDDIVKTRLKNSELASNYQHTFDTFIVGDNNKLAYAACKAVVQEPSTRYNPLYIYSEPGLGKTHLLSAVKSEMEKLHPDMNIIYTTADTFTDDYVSNLRTKSNLEAFKQKYRSCDLLLIDDMANFKTVMEEAFSDLLGFDVEVEILCSEDLTVEQKLKYGIESYADSSPKELQKELDDDDIVKTRLKNSELASNYQHTFDTFIVGDNNKLAYAACKAVVQEPSTRYNPLYIYSEPGLGKTHLLSAVKSEMEKLHPDMNIIYTTADTFTDDYVSNLRTKSNLEAFKQKYRSCDLLLIDDIQFMANKSETQQELFHTFNSLYNQNKQIIFTSDRPPKELNGIEQRLISRFEQGLLADIAPPEYETRIAIIKRKAELYGMNLPDSIVDFLADKLKTNIRQLEGAITKINALTLVTGSTPTLNMAQQVVRDIQSNHEPIPLTVEKIIAEVGKIYSVTPEDMRSQKRSSQISTARQVAIYVVNRITGLSYSNIGVEFGNRDHSTIVYAINKVKSTIKKDPTFKGMVDDMIKNLGNNA